MSLYTKILSHNEPVSFAFYILHSVKKRNIAERYELHRID